MLVRVERLALVCAAVTLTACSGRDKNASADSAGMSAPMSDTMSGMSGARGAGGAGGAGATSGSMGSSTDTANRGAMSGSSTSGGTSGARGMSGATGAGATGAGGAGAGGAGAGGAGGAQNQTQSGVTNTKKGTSTLGPNIKKVGPTTAADSAAQRRQRP